MSKPKVATMSINAGGEKVAYKVGQVLDLHGINATVKAVEDLDLIIEYPNGAVREMGKTYLAYYAKYASLPDGAKFTRPVEGGEGREFLYILDCLPTSYDVSVIDRNNSLSDQNMTPYKAVIEWHMDGLAVDPTRAPATSYTPKVADDQPVDHVTDTDDMVSREEFDAAVKTSVDTSIRNAQLVKDKEKLTAQLEDERRQNLTLIMDNVNLQDKVESLERKVSALAIRVPVDMKYTQVNLSQYETKDALLKDLKDGWEVAHETVLENSPTIYRYRLVQYGKPPVTAPTPLQAGASVVVGSYSEGQTVTASTPGGLQLTYNRVEQPVMERGKTRRIPEDVIEQANAEVRNAVSNAMEAARRQLVNKPSLTLGAFQHAINTD